MKLKSIFAFALIPQILLINFIKNNPSIIDDYYSYYLRSYVKKKLNDPYGEISDLNKAIKRNKLNFELYVNRGLTKQEIGDIKGACSDWRKASSLGYKEARAWVEEEC